MENSVVKKNNLFNKIIDMISGIFIPIINVLMAAALLKGILLLAVNAGWIGEADGVYRILYALSDGFFYFLPIFLAYTSANKLKADPFTAVIIAAALLYPGISEAFESGIGFDFLGISVTKVTYQSSVIPIILAVALLHYVELPLEKFLPETIKGFLKPMISMVIVVPVTFLLFGPIGALAGNALAGAYSTLYEFNPVVAGVIFGLIWQPMVLFGFQWGLVPVIINNISSMGVDTILPLLGPAVLGQAGAAMAVSLLTKNKRMKTVAFSGSVTAILGVTEPVLYGVNLPLKRPMVAACIAGAIGGGIVGTSHAGAVAFAFPSMISLVVYFGEGFWTFFFACILGFVLGFLLTMLFKIKEPKEMVNQ
ncbi:MAG TPA: PTS transporter subunit EIIC [Mobilitalea sp.]|nr:PTS transporter subunit EIIC [Mobilitalea sp.]